MSKQQGGNFDIPLPLIVLGYILSPPVGVVLTLLKVFAGGKTTKKETEAETISAPKQEPAKTEKKPKRAGFCVPAFVLTIIAAVFLFCSAVNIADGLTGLSMQAFLSGGYLQDSLILLLLSAAAFIPSRILKAQNDRRNIIRSIIGRRETILLSQLSAASDIPLKKLRKELQSMINRGEFGDEAYLDLAAGRFMRHPDVVAETSSREEESTSGTADSDQFRSIILQIRKLNDDIKDYAVSERIYRIEEHTQNIFDYVTKHPEAMPQIRTFMSYYLPTTLKLLESYSQIEQVGVAGENMKKSKENIERILDMLVVGYEQQVDKLFKNESLDISSEITVLEAMMKQDGLDGRNDFSAASNPGYTDDLSAGSAAAAQSKPDTTE